MERLTPPIFKKMGGEAIFLVVCPAIEFMILLEISRLLRFCYRSREEFCGLTVYRAGFTVYRAQLVHIYMRMVGIASYLLRAAFAESSVL